MKGFILVRLRGGRLSLLIADKITDVTFKEPGICFVGIIGSESSMEVQASFDALRNALLKLALTNSPETTVDLTVG